MNYAVNYKLNKSFLDYELESRANSECNLHEEAEDSDSDHQSIKESVEFFGENEDYLSTTLSAKNDLFKNSPFIFRKFGRSTCHHANKTGHQIKKPQKLSKDCNTYKPKKMSEFPKTKILLKSNNKNTQNIDKTSIPTISKISTNTVTPLNQSHTLSKKFPSNRLQKKRLSYSVTNKIKIEGNSLVHEHEFYNIDKINNKIHVYENNKANKIDEYDEDKNTNFLNSNLQNNVNLNFSNEQTENTNSKNHYYTKNWGNPPTEIENKSCTGLSQVSTSQFFNKKAGSNLTLPAASQELKNQVQLGNVITYNPDIKKANIKSSYSANQINQKTKTSKTLAKSQKSSSTSTHVLTKKPSLLKKASSRLKLSEPVKLIQAISKFKKALKRGPSIHKSLKKKISFTRNQSILEAESLPESPLAYSIYSSSSVENVSIPISPEIPVVKIQKSIDLTSLATMSSCNFSTGPGLGRRNSRLSSTTRQLTVPSNLTLNRKYDPDYSGHGTQTTSQSLINSSKHTKSFNNLGPYRGSTSEEHTPNTINPKLRTSQLLADINFSNEKCRSVLLTPIDDNTRKFHSTSKISCPDTASNLNTSSNLERNKVHKSENNIHVTSKMTIAGIVGAKRSIKRFKSFINRTDSKKAISSSSLKSNRSKLDSITSQLSQKTISPEKDSKLTKIADSIEPNQIGLLGIDLDLIFHDSVKSIKILSKKRKFIYSSKLTLLNKNLLSEGIHQAIESQLNENSAVGSLGSSVVGIQQRSSLPQPPCVKNYIQSNKYSDKDHYWVILLTDMILITKHEEEINKYKVMQAPIKLNKIYEVHGCGNMFNIFMKDSKTSKLQSISFQASTVDLAEMWKKLINKHKSKNSLINLHDESNNSICTSNKTSQQNTITTTASDTDYCSDVYIGESGVETGNFSEDDSSIPNFITSAGGNSQITTASTVSASVRSTTILDNTSSISSSTKKSSLDSFQPVQYSKSITSTYSMGSHGSSVNNINMNSTTSKKQHTQSASIYLPQNFNASQKRKSLQLNNKSEENLSKNQKALIKSWIRRKSNKFIKDNTSSQSEDNYCKCHSLASTPVNSLPGHFSHSQDSDICHHCNKPSKSKFSNKPKTSYLTDKLQSSLSIDDDEVDSGNNTSNSTNIGETESTSQGVTITVLKDDSHFNHNNRNSNNYNNQNSNNSPSEDPTLSLDILLKNDKLRSNFKEFLESEFSDENLEFYEAIETLQKNFNEIDASSLEFYQQSKMIINTFIIANSPREINIDAATRNLLLEEMKNKTISVNTLGVAQSKIYNLMARDSFVRFLKSNFYKN